MSQSMLQAWARCRVTTQTAGTAFKGISTPLGHSSVLDASGPESQAIRLLPLDCGLSRSNRAWPERLERQPRVIHLRTGEQISTDYLAINLVGLVPYWIEGDLNLAQSIAII